MQKLLAILILLVVVRTCVAAESAEQTEYRRHPGRRLRLGQPRLLRAPDDLKTPNLDRLAKEGRRFTHAYAPGSVCSPTRYGLMTGRYYWRTSVKDGKVLPGNGPLHIETDRMTLASLCKSQGYRTAAFGKWHLGMTTEPHHGLESAAQARTAADWFRSLLRHGRQHRQRPAQLHRSTKRSAATFPAKPSSSARATRRATTQRPGIEKPWQPDQIVATLTEHVIDWIEDNRDRPFFVYYAPNAVHEPMVPNPKFTGSRYGKYGDFIDELDWSVGEILDKLDQHKLTPTTRSSSSRATTAASSRRAMKTPRRRSRRGSRSTARCAAASTANGKAASASHLSFAGLATCRRTRNPTR